MARSGQLPGARVQDWLRQFKRAQHRRWPLIALPGGSPAFAPILRFSSRQGRAIPCELRLVLAQMRGSENAFICGTGH